MRENCVVYMAEMAMVSTILYVNIVYPVIPATGKYNLDFKANSFFLNFYFILCC